MREAPTHAARTCLPEVSLVFGLVTVIAFVLDRMGSAPPWSEHVHVAIAALFLWTALHMAQRDPRGVAWYGLTLGGLFSAPESNDAPAPSLWSDLRAALPLLLREFAVACALAAVIFPPFVVGFWLWHAPPHAFVWQWPSDTLSFVLAQVLVVGLPEEALFRGYVQSRLTDRFPVSWQLRRWTLPWLAVVLQALLFGAIHAIVDVNAMRMSVFFPGLVFGVLRATRGGIGAAVFFHALCNLLSDVLVRGWL